MLGAARASGSETHSSLVPLADASCAPYLRPYSGCSDGARGARQVRQARARCVSVCQKSSRSSGVALLVRLLHYCLRGSAAANQAGRGYFSESGA